MPDTMIDTRAGNLMTVPAAMATLRVSRPTLYTLMADGSLTVIRRGSAWPRLLRDEVERFAKDTVRRAQQPA